MCPLLRVRSWCVVYGGGRSEMPDCCAKRHDKRKPNRYLLRWCRVAYLHTQHLHTDGNDLCGHGDWYARTHNASSSLCCSSCSGLLKVNPCSFRSTQFLMLRSQQMCYRNILYTIVSWCQATCRACHFTSSLPVINIAVLPLTKVSNIARKRDEQYHKIWFGVFTILSFSPSSALVQMCSSSAPKFTIQIVPPIKNNTAKRKKYAPLNTSELFSHVACSLIRTMQLHTFLRSPFYFYPSLNTFFFG